MAFSNINTILFDYGGTLDTDGRHWSHILKEGYGAAGISVSEARFRDAYVVGERALARRPIIYPSDDFRTLLAKKVGLELDALVMAGHLAFTPAERQRAIDGVADYCDAYVRRNLETSRRVLDAARESGRRLVLVTNFYGNMAAVLRGYGLEGRFSAIVESAVVGVRKPDAAIYRLGLEAVGARAEDTLVVGDSYGKDIVPAKSLGCHAVWLRGQGWSPEDDQLEAPLADATIHHLAELTDLIRRD